MTEYSFRRFERFGIVCIVVVYLLILVGGIVRSTGAGMGCPDWPTCFGRIVPPTKESELPSDYQIRYKEHGYASMKFNVVKTWTEYVNRLLGVTTGLFMIILFLLSFSYKKKDVSIVKLTGLALLLVILEGVLGMLVVKMNLEGGTVTVHFWGSIIIILLLIYMVAKTRKESLIVTEVNNLSKLKPLVLILIALTVVQVILGTQVRQEVERISILLNYSERSTWIERLSPVFYVHRSFSILILVAHCFFVYQIKKSIRDNNILSKMSVVLLGILIIEIIGGIILNYLNVPAIVQPVHMLLGSILMGLQFFILFIINFSSKKVRQATV